MRTPRSDRSFARASERAARSTHSLFRRSGRRIHSLPTTPSTGSSPLDRLPAAMFRAERALKQSRPSCDRHAKRCGRPSKLRAVTSWCCARYSAARRHELKGRRAGVLFLSLESELKKKSERDRHELVDAALRRASRDAVVASFQEHCERSRSERCSESTIEPEIVLRLCASDI